MNDLPAWLVPAAASAAAVGVPVSVLLWRMRGRQRQLRSALDAATTRLDAAQQPDPLTGLPQRAAVEARLEELAARTEGACVLYVGLDDFDLVNGAFGHSAADAVLRAVARRLSRCAGDQAVGRIGGADFVVLAEGPADGGRALAQSLLDTLLVPVPVGEAQVVLRASVGLAHHPEHGARPRLVGRALTAMRAARAAGGASFCEYRASLEDDLRERAELATDLRNAIERNQLSLMYQPKVDAQSLQVTAAEALLRWQHPRRGLVSPAVFIPVAERVGLIGAIGDWVVREATRQAGIWRDQGLRMRVAINVSGYQMRQHDFVERLQRELAAHRLSPARFTCEITESVAMEDTQVTREAFERLRRAGVHVSIDDFGTGHSSLAWLRRLPAAELKIDRAFVTDLGTDDDALPIARAIVEMAHTLGLRVVAEGVETAAQRDLLIGLGCDELQGFLFARPMTPQALGLWADDSGNVAPMAFRASLFQETRPAPIQP